MFTWSLHFTYSSAYSLLVVLARWKFSAKFQDVFASRGGREGPVKVACVERKKTALVAATGGYFV